MKDSKTFAKEIRKIVLTINHNADASHSGGALSMADLLAVLYGQILHLDPAKPDDPQRDRFILSKGHACSALYAALAIKGFFPKELLKEYGQNGSLLLTHTSCMIPGVELSTGSLGHGLSVGCGMALAAKRQGKEYRTYVLTGDGELDEGSNWEAILFAPQHRLDNLILIVDYNKIQSLGNVREVLDLDPLRQKFEAFNWETFEIDGHDHGAIFDTFSKLTANGKPKVIIANTVKGKGVDFMENKLLWHYRSPNNEQLADAINQINQAK